jgi:7-cyano-7-deazaguanine synthase
MMTRSGKTVPRKAIVLFSGGIDSTACTHFLLRQGFLVRAVFVDYSQAAAEHEELAVKKLARALSIEVTRLRIQGLHTSGKGELTGRNSLLFSAALFVSQGRGCVIASGIHAGTSYYDCSKQFLEAMDRLTKAQTDGRVSLFSPFAAWTKRDIFDYTTANNVPITLTYSCESGTMPTCGRCASCRDRAKLLS